MRGKRIGKRECWVLLIVFIVSCLCCLFSFYFLFGPVCVTSFCLSLTLGCGFFGDVTSDLYFSFFSSTFVGSLKRTMSLGRLTRKRTRSKSGEQNNARVNIEHPL